MAVRETPLLLRSYASDASETSKDTTQWTMFVRQLRAPLEGDNGGSEFVFTVVVPNADGTSCAIYERRLGHDAMEKHIDELGIEVEAAAFDVLLLKTLAVRKCVDVAVDGATGVATVSVVLTYKFSESISRRGRLAMALVVTDVPMAVAALLMDVHSIQNEAVLTELQKLRKQQRTATTHKQRSAASDASSRSLSLSQESNASTDGDAAVAPTPTSSGASVGVNPLLLKRRHVPTGTVRRNGPRGAKLAKIE